MFYRVLSAAPLFSDPHSQSSQLALKPGNLLNQMTPKDATKIQTCELSLLHLHVLSNKTFTSKLVLISVW